MYETVYTVGCFDRFHRGHVNLLSRMRGIGRVLIVGVHDDPSFETLKRLAADEHDPIAVRMQNVKRHADRVFIVTDTDPTASLESMISAREDATSSCFVRADDMPDFPGRAFVESRIAVLLVPYTQGISSTSLRRA